MADFVLGLEGRIDKAKTKANIEKELNGNLGQELNSQELLKFIGGLNIAKTKQRIQSQLATISKDFKVDIQLGNIDVTKAKSNIQSAIQSATANTNGTTGVSNVSDIHASTASIKAQTQALFDSANASDKAKEKYLEFVKAVDSTNLSVDKWSTTIKTTGQGTTLETINVKGTDEIGREIELRKTANEVVIQHTENLEKQRQVEERKNKEAERTAEKQKQNLEQQQDNLSSLARQLDSIRAKYSEIGQAIPNVSYDNNGKANANANATYKQGSYASAYNDAANRLEQANQSLLNGEEIKKEDIRLIQDIISETENLGKAVQKEQQEEQKATQQHQQALESIDKLLSDQQTKLDKIRTTYSELKQPLNNITYDESTGKAITNEETSYVAGSYASAYNDVINRLTEINKLHQEGNIASQEDIKLLKEAISETERLGKIAKAAQAVDMNFKPTDFSSAKEIYQNGLDRYVEQVNRLGESGQELLPKIDALKEELSKVGDTDDQKALDSFIDKLRVFKSELSLAQEQKRTLDNAEKQQQNATKLGLSRDSFISDINQWLADNTKISAQTKNAIIQIREQALKADNIQLGNLQKQFKNLTKEAKLAGDTGKKAFDIIKEKVGKFTSWFSIAQGVMLLTNRLKDSISELKEVDTLLTEISKTSDMTEQQLEKLGYTAFDSAKKYGVTVQAFLTGVQEMSRAGYGDNAAQMADLSILAQSAGDMTADVANNYLIATDAAYELNGSVEKLGKVLDGQNMINIIVPLYGNIQRCSLLLSGKR